MHRRFLFVILVCAVAAPLQLSAGDPNQAQFDRAERNIRRLEPSAFSELPGNIVRELERRGCRVPQEAFTKKRHDVIPGEFSKAGQTNSAVLCSCEGWSSILVLWNGSERESGEIARNRDRNYLQVITADEIGYSRGILTVGQGFIMEHYHAYGGPEPPAIDHDGVDDAFIEKASVTYYFHGGKWLMLTGAD